MTPSCTCRMHCWIGPRLLKYSCSRSGRSVRCRSRSPVFIIASASRGLEEICVCQSLNTFHLGGASRRPAVWEGATWLRGWSAWPVGRWTTFCPRLAAGCIGRGAAHERPLGHLARAVLCLKWRTLGWRRQRHVLPLDQGGRGTWEDVLCRACRVGGSVDRQADYLPANAEEQNSAPLPRSTASACARSVSARDSSLAAAAAWPKASNLWCILSSAAARALQRTLNRRRCRAQDPISSPTNALFLHFTSPPVRIHSRTSLRPCCWRPTMDRRVCARLLCPAMSRCADCSGAGGHVCGAADRS